jgi:hypothetical protein
MDLTFAMKLSGILFLIINTMLVVNKCHVNKTTDHVEHDLIIASLLISLIWLFYGIKNKLTHFYIGYSVVLLLQLYLLYLCHVFN